VGSFVIKMCSKVAIIHCAQEVVVLCMLTAWVGPLQHLLERIIENMGGLIVHCTRTKQQCWYLEAIMAKGRATRKPVSRLLMVSLLLPLSEDRHCGARGCALIYDTFHVHLHVRLAVVGVA
jgi:hypothetical protein